MTILTLALYALLILLVTVAADKPCGSLARDKARALANEIRWRWCRFWYTQVKWRLKG